MSIDGILLFSGGLDSLLCARLLMDQGLSIRCLHCVSPFFGSAGQARRWQHLYNLDLEILDVGEIMADLIRDWPPHGLGSVMNPCVDCKITLLRLAKKRMLELGASFVATGEVLGQRPMSQRRDVMNLIRHAAEVDDILLRPLCAKHLEPVACERSGLVDRERLLDLHGRGRQGQLALAKALNLTEIPSPAGGCRLTEKENARHYWPLRMHRPLADAQDYRLASCGRQLWRLEENPACWLCVARNSRDNAKLTAFARDRDLLAGLCDCPGPVALLRDGRDWPAEALTAGLSQFISYAPKAANQPTARVWLKQTDGSQQILTLQPDLSRTAFRRPDWEEVKAEKHALASRYEAERVKRLRAEKEARRAARAQAAEEAAGTQEPCPLRPDTDTSPAGAPEE